MLNRTGGGSGGGSQPPPPRVTSNDVSNGTTSGGSTNVAVVTNPIPATQVVPALRASQFQPSAATPQQPVANIRHNTAILTFEGSDHTSMNPLPEAPRARLDLNVGIDNYRPIDSLGFSDQRPEVIATFNFEPAYDSINVDGSATPVAEMLDLQLSARQLRAENIVKLINELKADTEAAKTITELERRLVQAEDDIENEVGFLFEMVQRLTSTRRSLSVKGNAAHIHDDVVSRDPLAVSDDPVMDVMVNVLGFSETGYHSFSDTKILMQMLEDLFNIIKSYSPALVARIDPRRSQDVDPFSINKFTDATAGATNNFNVSSLKSDRQGAPPSILQRSGVDNFNAAFQSLTNFDDRLKVILAFMSRELRVSAGLSNPSVRASITNAFGLSDAEIDSGVFDKVIGDAGTSIFTDADGGSKSSLIKLLRVKIGTRIVLPFESSFIKKIGGDTVPGQKFYVDSIIKGNKKFDTAPFTSYATTFGTLTQALATIIEGTLDVNVINQDSLGLNADDMLDRFLRTVKLAVNEISTREQGVGSVFTDTHPADARDTFTPALLLAAANDTFLKHMLTLYVTIVGVKGATEPGAAPSIFRTLIGASNFNAGTNQTVAQNPVAGIEAAIAAVLPDVEANPQSAFGAHQQGTDDSQRFLTTTDQTNPNHGIDVISSAIVARVLDLQASSNFVNSSISHPEYDVVADYRAFDKLSSFGAGDPGYLLKGIVDLINSFDAFARNASPTPYLSNQALTRFNQIGAHTIIRLIIEMFVTFFKAFPIASFSGASTAPFLSGEKVISVLRNDSLTSELKAALEQLTPPSGLIAIAPQLFFIDSASHESGQRIQAIVDRFASMKFRFSKEDDIIKKIVNILLAVGNGLKVESAETSRFFDPTGPNGQMMASLLALPGSDEKLGGLDDAQVTLSRNMMLEHRASRELAAAQVADSGVSHPQGGSPSPFIDDTVVPPQVKATLLSMLRSTQFMLPVASNLRIMTVGIPAGFIASLHERMGSFNVGQDFNEYSKRLKIQSDVIRIHVYMKDLLLEDVVFKPQTFIFQLGRFVAAPDFNGIVTDARKDFSTLLGKINTRVLSPDASTFLNESLDASNLAVGSSYDGIATGPDRIELASNHVKSYLMGVYLRLLTGIDFAEDNFYLDEKIADLRVDPETQVLFEKLLTDRVSAFAGRKVSLNELRNSNENVRILLDRIGNDDITAGVIDTLGKVLGDASKAVNIELSDDLINFMKVFSPRSILFGAGARRQRVTAPKLFERVFHIPVDPDDFEIDQELTHSTTSGRAFMTSRLATAMVQTNALTRLPLGSDFSRVQLGKFNPIRFDPSIRRELGNMTLQQFFVVIEQLPELSEVPYLSPKSIPRGNVDVNAKKQLTSTFNSRIMHRNDITTISSVAKTDIYDATPNSREGQDWSKII